MNAHLLLIIQTSILVVEHGFYPDSCKVTHKKNQKLYMVLIFNSVFDKTKNQDLVCMLSIIKYDKTK